MPLILNKPNPDGSHDVMIVLGSENIERMKEHDPVEIKWRQLPFGNDRVRLVGISYADDARMMQMTQLARQGKVVEAVKMATSGFKYRPEKGDHDLGYEKLS